MLFIIKWLNIYGGGGLYKGWGSVLIIIEGSLYEDFFGLIFIGGIELLFGKFNLMYDIKLVINFIGGECMVYI